MKVLIFFLSLATLYSLSLYNASEFIENLRKTKPADETLLKNAIDNTIEFLKHHIYYIVSSDPPQPDFDNSYFEKKDILNLFKDVKIKDTNYFDFKNEFFSAIYKLNDLHTTPYFGLFPIENYYYICPISLITKYDIVTNKAKMYGNFSFQPENYTYFKNYEQVVKVINDNLNTAIKSINGKGLCRRDYLYDEDNNKLYLNEINTLPGFTNISMYPMLMKEAGYSYKDLISTLIESTKKDA